MTKYFTLLFLLLIVSASAFSQLPVNKNVKFIFSKNEYRCLQKDSYNKFSVDSYKDLPTQSWKILPTDEADLYYLQLSTGEYLQCIFHNRFIGFSFSDSLALTDADNFKFAIKPTGFNNWSISPKKDRQLFLQQYGATPNVVAEPKMIFPEANFLIEYIPIKPQKKTNSNSISEGESYSRPVPDLVSLTNSLCDVGILKNLNPIALYGATATFYPPGGRYPSRFLLRIFLSENEEDRMEILIYDDVRKARNKSYVLEPLSEKHQSSIKFYKKDKLSGIMNKATIDLDLLIVRNNIFTLSISKAIATEGGILSEYDIVAEGIYTIDLYK